MGSRSGRGLVGGRPVETAELVVALRTYIREQFSASRAARALFTHRNTVLNRLGRATELLPAPLAGLGLRAILAGQHWREDRRRREAWLAQRLRALDAGDREVLERAAAVLDRLASE